MTGYLIRRLIYGVFVLIGVNVLTFALFFFVNTPDDMARAQLGGLALVAVGERAEERVVREVQVLKLGPAEPGLGEVAARWAVAAAERPAPRRDERVLAVEQGRSLSDVMPQVHADLRPGVQALTFHVLRHMGTARALVGDRLYVANTDAILRFDWQPGQTRLQGTGIKVTDLPAGPINHHWTKNLIASEDGRKLFVTVGSNSNVGENGMPAEAERAAEEDEPDTGRGRRRGAEGVRAPPAAGTERERGDETQAARDRERQRVRTGPLVRRAREPRGGRRPDLMAGEDPAQASARVQQFTERVRFTQATALVNADPGAALKAFDADDEIGCMIVTGSEKAFAAGADIGAMACPPRVLRDG